MQVGVVVVVRVLRCKIPQPPEGGVKILKSRSDSFGFLRH